jgi:KUP system potassium uptake protein
VTLAMLIDSISLFVVMRRLWRWPTVVALVIAVPFFVIDVAFLASNSLKIPEGGWFPILSGIVVFTCSRRGSAARDPDEAPVRRRNASRPVHPERRSVAAHAGRGTAIFLTSSPIRCRTRCCTT